MYPNKKFSVEPTPDDNNSMTLCAYNIEACEKEEILDSLYNLMETVTEAWPDYDFLVDLKSPEVTKEHYAEYAD